MRLLWRLFLLYRPYWGWLALGALIACAAVLANVALMGASGWFITAMAVAGASGVSLNYFAPATLIRAAAILRSLGRYAERLVTHEATLRLISRLRIWLFRRLEPQPATALSAYRGSDLSARLRTDLDRLETVYLRLFAPVAVAVVTGGLILVWLLLFSPAVALVEGILLVAAGFALPLALNRLSARLGARQVQLSTELTEAAVSGVQGLPELLALGAEGAHLARFTAKSAALIGVQKRLGRLFAGSQAGMTLCSNLALWGAVAIAIPLVRQGGLSGADLVMVAMVALAGFEAVAPLPAAFLALGGALASARRIFALADAGPAGEAVGTAGEATEAPPPPPARCDLRLDQVSFAYGPADAPVLDRFDLDLPAGTKVAVVGPAGVGKSTLMLLLAGLLDPTGGRIWLDGRGAETFDGEARRRLFAVAPQDCGLFSGRVGDILRLGRPEASDAELWHALDVVQLRSFVANLPEGLETWLGEAGLTLSGGEARRLSIARALVKAAPVLILDEPGEGLDFATERDLLDAVVRETEGRTLLLITHRHAGLNLMDRIVTLP